MRVTLIRHATTRWNEQARYQGWTDIPLSPSGIAEARALAHTLADRLLSHPVDAVLSSDLGRCVETAQIVFPNQVIRPTPELRELSFGAWEGLTYQECLDRDPVAYSQWLDNPSAIVPPEGEQLQAFEARIQGVFDTLFAEYRRDDQAHIAIVTHGGPIRYILRQGIQTGIQTSTSLTPSSIALSTRGNIDHLSPCGVVHLLISPDSATIIPLE